MNMKEKRSQQITRREFVGKALLTAGVSTGAPPFLWGQDRNDKLNIAFIACGGRANASLSELTIVPGAASGRDRSGRGAGGAAEPTAPHPDENVTVLCDVNQVALDAAAQHYPKAKKFNDLRRLFDNPNDF